MPFFATFGRSPWHGGGQDAGTGEGVDLLVWGGGHRRAVGEDATWLSPGRLAFVAHVQQVANGGQDARRGSPGAPAAFCPCWSGGTT